MALPTVLSFPILKQGDSGLYLGLMEGRLKPQWGSNKRMASLGPLDPKGLAGAFGGRGLWPGRGHTAPGVSKVPAALHAWPNLTDRSRCVPGRPNEGHRGLGQHSLKHQRAPGLNPEGRYGLSPEKAAPAPGHTARLGQGRPLKAMPASQEPSKGLSSLTQLQADPSDLGPSGTGAQLPGGIEEPAGLGGGVPTSQL